MRLGIRGLGFGGRRAGGGVAILSDLAYDTGTNLLSLATTVASGTVYYALDAAATPLSGAAIKSGAAGSIAVSSGVVSETEDLSSTPPGTWYLNVVQETVGGFSNVLVLEITIAAFDPATLAALLWDASDTSRLWQDTAGTTAVTATGQSVARLDNAGTLGGAFLNTGGTDSPVYTESGALRYLQFDGSNDYLLRTGTAGEIDLDAGYYLIATIHENTANSLRGFLAASAIGASGYNHTSGFQLDASLNSANAVSFNAGTDNANGLQLLDASAVSLALAVVEIEVTPANGSPNGFLRIRRSGDPDVVLIASDTANSGQHPNTATATALFALGCRINSGAAGSFAIVRHYAGALVTGAIATDKRAEYRAWAAEKAGF